MLFKNFKTWLPESRWRKFVSLPKKHFLRLYYHKNFGINTIAKSFKLPNRFVYAYIKHHAIKIKTRGNRLKLWRPPISKSKIKHLYFDKKLSWSLIAKKIGVKTRDIQQIFKYYNLKGRSYKEAGKILSQTNPEWKRKCTKHLKNGLYYNKKTWIEKSFEFWAKENGIKIKYQFRIPGSNSKHRYDYRIKDTNILVEMDGVFWHTKRGAKQKDLWYDKVAQEHGYIVIRITDKELKEYGLEVIDRKLSNKKGVK